MKIRVGSRIHGEIARRRWRSLGQGVIEQKIPHSPPAAEPIADRSQERTLEPWRFPSHRKSFDLRVVFLTSLAAAIGLAAGAAAVVLLKLIGLVTNVSFYGRLSASFVSPAANHLGLMVLGVPVIGGVIVGLMARYGSEAIRGHGIPEVMERVLANESRIAPRVGVLKPISAAIAIGTGCPFGAEGPIIVTGGAIGSLVGQFLSTTAQERKILLAAGAAAGMSATFGSPVSGVLLAVELLLFEFRPRSLIPVAVASATAAALRDLTAAPWPMFPMQQLQTSGMAALLSYTLIGAIVGLASVGATRAVYAVEDTFARLPIHWMWWPAMGGLVVGLVGYVLPATLGVGYDNIVHIFTGTLAEKALIMLFYAQVCILGGSARERHVGGNLGPPLRYGRRARRSPRRRREPVVSSVWGGLAHRRDSRNGGYVRRSLSRSAHVDSFCLRDYPTAAWPLAFAQWLIGGLHGFKFTDEEYTHDGEDRSSGRLCAIGI